MEAGNRLGAADLGDCGNRECFAQVQKSPETACTKFQPVILAYFVLLNLKYEILLRGNKNMEFKEFLTESSTTDLFLMQQLIARINIETNS